MFNFIQGMKLREHLQPEIAICKEIAIWVVRGVCHAEKEKRHFYFPEENKRVENKLGILREHRSKRYEKNQTI